MNPNNFQDFLQQFLNGNMLGQPAPAPEEDFATIDEEIYVFNDDFEKMYNG